MDGRPPSEIVKLPLRPRGEERRLLRIGSWRCGLRGLDAPLATDLDDRWGRFSESADGPLDIVIRVHDNPDGWLEPPLPGESYRVEARDAGEDRVFVSYGFAVWRARPEDGVWSVALAARSPEPAERRLENACRVILADHALAVGGFALHAGGVLHQGSAFLFAGPSRTGKTTAIRNCRPAISLGDDFAFVIPVEGRWCTPALPFDNSERITHDPPRGWHPVAWIWRLFQERELRVERPGATLAVASLMTSVAFPWLFADRTDALLASVRRFVVEGRFGHLGVARESDLWTELITNSTNAPR